MKAMAMSFHGRMKYSKQNAPIHVFATTIFNKASSVASNQTNKEDEHGCRKYRKLMASLEMEYLSLAGCLSAPLSRILRGCRARWLIIWGLEEIGALMPNIQVPAKTRA